MNYLLERGGSRERWGPSGWEGSWSLVFINLHTDQHHRWTSVHCGWNTQTWNWWVDALCHFGETLSCYLLIFFFCLVFSLLSSWDSNDTYVRPLWSCYTCLLCSVLLFNLFALLCMSWETFPLCLSSRPLSSAMAGLLLMPSVEFWIPDVLFFTCNIWCFLL